MFSSSHKHIRLQQGAVLHYVAKYFIYYRLSDRANMWIGGDVIFNNTDLYIEGSADLYVGVPRIDMVYIIIYLKENMRH